MYHFKTIPQENLTASNVVKEKLEKLYEEKN